MADFLSRLLNPNPIMNQSGGASPMPFPQMQPQEMQRPGFGQNFKSNIGPILQALGMGIASGDLGRGAAMLPGLVDNRQQRQMQIQEQQQEAQQRNATAQWFRQKDPEIAAMLDQGVIDGKTAVSMWQEKQQMSQQGQKRNLVNAGDGRLYDADSGEWIMAPGGGPQDDFAKRKQIAEQYGLAPDDPAYKSFVLTGKMPREDQAPLTATDKKAILEADEMVASNEAAIAALDRAAGINDQANQGFMAGPRAKVGSLLPDMMVPDFISSPESSAATIQLDNEIMGQALQSMKAIFGANPTEGERAILLELQASSSMPKEARKGVIARAKALAQKRLAFNKERAEGMRGGTYYKNPQAGASQPVQDGGMPDFSTMSDEELRALANGQ